MYASERKGLKDMPDNQSNNGQPWDVIIVGAGIAGLTSSIFLAQGGLSVLLLDKGSQPGGRAASTGMASASVNLGAHALFKSGLAILQEAGAVPAGSVPGPPDTFVFKGEDGGSIAFPLSRLLLGSFLKWHEKTELIRFYSRLRRTDTSRLQAVTLQAYLESQISSMRVRSALLALVRVSTYCDAPGLISAGAVIEQLKHGQVLYVDGGWQTLVKQLTNHARKAGVSIRTGSPVSKITGSHPEMTVFLKDGTQLNSRYVISTAGPKDTLAMLDPALEAEEAAVYNKLIPVHAACLDLVMPEIPRPRTRFVLGADYPWYYSNHSAAAVLSEDPTLAVVHVMKYLPPSGADDPASDRVELEGFLDLIQPGWRSHVIKQRYLPRMLVSHAAVTAEGGGTAGRPGVAVAGRPGLYVAGDWAGPVGMLVNASLHSARQAARSILAIREVGK
ncbi:NAD(P)/FAD-dependent oxidoreductase [Paenibacillus sp. PK3_47]|uniref:phytoene desaturase family protein n=1 Tax=Paenibacillus sp. PK3_47 TaxID=2072642 RepID=UPI00201D8C38|nr:NAD(P)/FAD-dependent oxidoreductase [Paenibacillus sp. PK3_47]UQZ36785.1 NAD(P)/FAD-dependent oxidoreductase [Paenibacillus sp. PK3_47]